MLKQKRKKEKKKKKKKKKKILKIGIAVVTYDVICSQGDTGGALVIEGQQVGISSWQRVPCGTQGFPAVYTQVSLYIDWITNNANL
jgi:secreted trypsin-like serine protease